MAQELEFETILGNPISKANHYKIADDWKHGVKTGGKHITKDKIIRDYEKSFKQQCTKYKNKYICSPFKLHAKVFFKSPQSDLDNILKTLLDCLQDVKCISDDNLCVEIAARKFVDRCNPRLVFAVQELQPSLF